MEYLIYLEIAVLCVSIICAVCVLHYVKKFAELQGKIHYIIEVYEHQFILMNQHLSNVESDTYFISQKLLRGGGNQ